METLAIIPARGGSKGYPKHSRPCWLPFIVKPICWLPFMEKSSFLNYNCGLTTKTAVFCC